MPGSVSLAASPHGPDIRHVQWQPFPEQERPADSSLTEGANSVEAGPFTSLADEPLKLRLFADKSVVEVLANGRQAVMRRMYPSRADSVGVRLFSNGGPAEARVVEAWERAPGHPY